MNVDHSKVRGTTHRCCFGPLSTLAVVLLLAVSAVCCKQWMSASEMRWKGSGPLQMTHGLGGSAAAHVSVGYGLGSGAGPEGALKAPSEHCGAGAQERIEGEGCSLLEAPYKEVFVGCSRLKEKKQI